MKRLIYALLISAAFLFFAFPAGAQPLTAVPPGEDQIFVVAKGQPAPVQGQLFDTPTAIRWGNYLQPAKYPRRCICDGQRRWFTHLDLHDRAIW
jgi:hypothetical protein